MNHDAVTVAGGGLIGMLSALALAERGIACRLVSPVPLSGSADNRATAVAMASWEFLETLDMTAGLATTPINRIRVADGHPMRGLSTRVLDFEAEQTDVKPFGFMLRNSALVTALQNAVRTSDAITLIEGAAVARVDARSGRVVVSDGQQWQSQVILGCDGKRSLVREQAGIRVTGWDYDCHAITTVISHRRDHRGTAVELFYPDGPFAILPLRQNSSSIVWTTPSSMAGTFCALPPEAFLQQVRLRFGDWLGPLSLEGTPVTAYPLSFLNAEIYARDRVFLLGDAAHTIHPIAGQGFNLGIRDISSLVSLLAAAPLDNVPELALAYERDRRLDVSALAVATDGLQRLFGSDLAVSRTLRRAGLAAVNRMPGLKQRFCRYAMGYA